MPSAETAGRRLDVVNFRASRVERERWVALAGAVGVPRSAWIRRVLEREGRRLERERSTKEREGNYTCTFPEVRPGVYCGLCGFPKRWTIYPQWQAGEQGRILRSSRSSNARFDCARSSSEQDTSTAARSGAILGEW